MQASGVVDPVRNYGLRVLLTTAQCGFFVAMAVLAGNWGRNKTTIAVCEWSFMLTMCAFNWLWSGDFRSHHHQLYVGIFDDIAVAAAASQRAKMASS